MEQWFNEFINSETGFIIIIALWLAFVIFIFVSIVVRARRNKTKLDRFCRWYWNSSMKFSSRMPLSGWAAHFIMVDDEEEAAEKEAHIEAAIEDADHGLTREIIKGFERRAEADRAYEQRIQLQNRLSDLSERKYGVRVELDADGKYGRIGNSGYMPIDELERKLR